MLLLPGEGADDDRAAARALVRASSQRCGRARRRRQPGAGNPAYWNPHWILPMHLYGEGLLREPSLALLELMNCAESSVGFEAD